MGEELSLKFVLLGLFVGIFSQAVIGAPEGVKFPESASDSSTSISEAGKVIEEILSASRAGRNLRLSVGGEDLEPLALASDPKLRELSSESGKDTEARSYVATKLCSLGLAKCGDERHGGGGQYGQYGLTNIRDVTLVQPVALKPVGEPIAAIPLENKPFSSGNGNYYGPSSSFGGFPSENRNYPNYQSQQGGLINSDGCTCVPVNQCNSYDIISHHQQAGSGNNGIINGLGRPNHGQVGAGIDPRNKKSEIESNSTIIESEEPSARSARSQTNDETSTNSTIIISTNQTREKREAPLLNTNSRVVNGAYQRAGCSADGRYVCCRNPIRNPNNNVGSNYPSSGGSSYPNGVSYPITGSGGSYPSSNSGSSYPISGSYPGNGGSSFPSTSGSYPGPPSDPYYPPAGGNGACGKRNSNGINGRVLNQGSYNNRDGQTEYGEYPWQVAILKKEGSNNLFVCGGSIIDSRHLLTAAHCIKNNRPEDLRVRLGEWDVNSENEFYPHVEFDVAAIAVHPEYYAGNLVNDVAIIKLNGFVDFSRHPQISPICLPPRQYDFTGMRCYTTGWGKDAFGQGGKFQRILQEVDVPVVNHYECEQRLKRTRLGPDFILHPGFLCAGGEPNKDACKGDGGGPLSCDVGGTWQLAGIVSWGVGCGEYGTPGVYVKTTTYLDWIRRTIQ